MLVPVLVAAEAWLLFEMNTHGIWPEDWFAPSTVATLASPAALLFVFAALRGSVTVARIDEAGTLTVVVHMLLRRPARVVVQAPEIAHVQIRHSRQTWAYHVLVRPRVVHARLGGEPWDPILVGLFWRRRPAAELAESVASIAGVEVEVLEGGS